MRDLTPADPANLTFALAYALCFEQGRKRGKMTIEEARPIAVRLVAHLQLSNFHVFQGPPRAAPVADYEHK